MTTRTTSLSSQPQMQMRGFGVPASGALAVERPSLPVSAWSYPTSVETQPVAAAVCRHDVKRNLDNLSGGPGVSTC